MTDETREEPEPPPATGWRKFVRWLVRTDAVVQQKPVHKEVNEKAAKVIDPFVK